MPEIYDDEALIPFFEYVAAGYCYKQAAELAELDQKRVERTMYSDKEVGYHVLDLSMLARERIVKGDIPVPGRYDMLYQQYEGRFYEKTHKKFFKNGSDFS